MNNLKIVFTDVDTVTSGGFSLDAFKEFGTTEIYGNLSPDEVAERAVDADIIICNKTRISRETIYKMLNLKFIGLFATGYNNIDITAANEKGIVVCNAGEYSTNSVAQQVFAYILHFANKVSEYDSDVKAGQWEKSDIFCILNHNMTELAGKTLGIFGYGSIGRRVSQIGKAFGMNVIVSTRTIRDDGTNYVTFDELLERSDFLTVHCPLTDKTKDIFNEKAFLKCKKGSFFINTSRGGTVVEKALYDALCSGRLAGAAVDVLNFEPMRADCILKNAPNIIITPHVAWAPYETRKRLIDIVYKNVKGYVEGNVINRVNQAMVD